MFAHRQPDVAYVLGCRPVGEDQLRWNTKFDDGGTACGQRDGRVLLVRSL